jgi:hypothetical protein
MGHGGHVRRIASATLPTAATSAATGADARFIKQALQFSLQRLMAMDGVARRRAAYAEHSEERTAAATAIAD